MKASRRIIAKFSFIILSATAIGSSNLYAQATSSAGMGKGLFNVEGANSCMFCHGITGEGGNIKDAADLSKPKTWKVYAALGGDAAYKKDSAKFMDNMKAATLNLIKMGAIRHNATYKAEGYDKSKIKNYTAQMTGLSGSASIAWMNKYKAKGITPDIAAESAWLHLQTLDKEGFFKK